VGFRHVTPNRPDVAQAALRIRQIVIEQSRRANVGHIGSCLSVADLLAVLYTRVLRASAESHAERDRFILSKGHAALALYGALHVAGYVSSADVESFCAEGSRFGVHPDHSVAGIDFSTGSLGHGLPMAVGAALGARLQGSSRRSFVLVSDAECNEGSLWEAVMFAAHHRLSNLVAIVDDNGQQALGKTTTVLNLSPLARRWAAFGWDVREAEGHDLGALEALFQDLDTRDGPPHVVVAHTTFGKGVSFMEGLLKWHYWPMSADEFAQARRELGAKDAPS
jgi:transketolase